MPACVLTSKNGTAHAPAVKAPHAPPALTFGLPGKQTVKRMRARRDLMGRVRGLPSANAVMAGLVPAIHVFLSRTPPRRGCPAQRLGMTASIPRSVMAGLVPGIDVSSL